MYINFWARQTRVNEHKKHTRMRGVGVIAVLLKMVVRGSYQERREKYNYNPSIATNNTNLLEFVIFYNKLINERNKRK